MLSFSDEIFSGNSRQRLTEETNRKKLFSEVKPPLSAYASFFLLYSSSSMIAALIIAGVIG